MFHFPCPGEWDGECAQRECSFFFSVVVNCFLANFDGFWELWKKQEIQDDGSRVAAVFKDHIQFPSRVTSSGQAKDLKEHIFRCIRYIWSKFCCQSFNNLGVKQGALCSSPFFVKMKKFEFYCATFDILHFVYHHVLFFYYDMEETNFSKVNGIKRRILPIRFGFSKPLGCVPFSRSKSAFCRQNWIDFSFHLDLNRYLKGYMHATWYVHAKWCMV